MSLSRQYRAKGDLFRTPREGRPYVLFIHSSPSIIPFAFPGNTVSHIHRSKKPPLPKGGVGGDSVSLPRQRRAKGSPPCPLRPCGAPPPMGGGLYMGRFSNRPYRNYSLFNIHSSPRIIPVLKYGRFKNRPYLFSSLFSVLCSLFSKSQRFPDAPGGASLRARRPTSYRRAGACSRRTPVKAQGLQTV